MPPEGSSVASVRAGRQIIEQGPRPRPDAMNEPHENRDSFADDARRRTRLRRTRRARVGARLRSRCAAVPAAVLRPGPSRRHFVPCPRTGGAASSGESGPWR
jgi:hypothetical protein